MRINNYLKLLEAKLNAWLRADEIEKFQQLNYILPVIQTISMSSFMLEFSEENEHQEISQKFQNMLKDFEKKFLSLSKINEISLKTQNSDFSEDMLHELQNSTKLNSRKLDNLRNDIIAKELKYENAHMRVAYNYGSFFKIILDKLSKEEAEKFKNNLKTALAQDDVKEFLDLVTKLPLEENAPYFPLDDLENHALLNQISNFTQNPYLLLNDSDILKAHKIDHRKKAQSRILSQTLAKVDIPLLKNVDTDITIGLETEFLLKNLKEITHISPAENIRNKNIELKKSLSDINARRNMQKKYGKEPNLPELKNLTPLLYSLSKEQVTEIIASNQELTEIKSFLQQNHQDLNQELLAGIANMSNEEIYFFHLLFCQGENFTFIYDGINDGKSLESNLTKACDLIKNNIWHEKTLDMIRASELSIGPFNANHYGEIVKHVKQMEDVADKCSLQIVSPNVQINFSGTMQDKNILLPKIAHDSSCKVTIPAIGKEFIESLQESLITVAKKEPNLLRSNHVNVSLDRKKQLQEELDGTEYFRIKEGEPAFSSHKRLAAKNTTLRLSKFSKDVGVIELRLVGNNPHFAQYNDANLLNEDDGLTKVLASMLPVFYNNLNSKSLTNEANHDVLVTPEGEITGIETKYLEAEKEKTIDDTKISPEAQHDFQYKIFDTGNYVGVIWVNKIQDKGTKETLCRAF